MQVEAFTDLLVPNSEGVPSLADRQLRGLELSDFRLPAPGARALVERVEFVDCSVSPGTCQIDGGAVLREVTFEEFSCGDALHISSDVFLDRVRVIGRKKLSMIWIKAPAREPMELDYSSVEWCLDIREFYGEVSIAGPPADKILRDPDRHVVFDRSVLEGVDWTGVGVSPLSYWKILAKKYRRASPQCVASTPPEGGRNYERSMRELDVLRAQGVLL